MKIEVDPKEWAGSRALILEDGRGQQPAESSDKETS